MAAILHVQLMREAIARGLPPEFIAKLEKEFGFDQPVLIDEADLVLKGHGRRLAAIKVGCLVPTVTRKGLTEDQKLAIVISDNALPAMTGFDQRLLKPQLTQEALVERALQYCDWAVAKGLLAIRSHVDVCDERLLAVLELAFLVGCKRDP